MVRVPQVKDIMVETSHSLHPDTEAYTAVDELIARQIMGAPVIDEDGDLVGFLTEKDCLRLLAVAHQYNMTGRRVRDIMSDIKESLHPTMDLLSAAMRFLNCNFATLPVLEGQQLVGSISRQNMMKSIQKMHHTNGLAKGRSKKNLRLVENPSSIEELQTLVQTSNNAQLASVFSRRHS